MNADGSGVVRLTENQVDDVNPSWSPDGCYISFTSAQAGNCDEPAGAITSYLGSPPSTPTGEGAEPSATMSAAQARYPLIAPR